MAKNKNKNKNAAQDVEFATETSVLNTKRQQVKNTPADVTNK